MTSSSCKLSPGIVNDSADLRFRVLFEFEDQAILDCPGFQIVQKFLLSLLSVFPILNPRGKNGEEKVDYSEDSRGHCHDVTGEGETFCYIRGKIISSVAIG